jgi:hypothetical protein
MERLQTRNSSSIVLMIFGMALFFADLTPVNAQVEADLALDVVVDPSGIAPPGTLGTITFTVMNLGPGTAATPYETVIDSNAFVITPEYFQAMDFANAGDCDFTFFFLDPPPGGDLGITYRFFSTNHWLRARVGSARGFT